MKTYQQKFIDFLVQSGALTFGDFVTKSGRKTPYFINTGKFDCGSKIHKLGSFYAAHIVELGFTSTNVIFGPAYKGVPLCVATASSLFNEHSLDVGFAFDRKEEKSHGDKGNIVGHKIQDGDKIILVEDVITAGTTLKKIVPFLKDQAQVEILATIVAVDRSEKGAGDLSALAEVEKSLGIQVKPITDIHQVVKYLSRENDSGVVLEKEMRAAIEGYLGEYGARS